MPWTVGIDEAGYGPNLGPLLQAAVAVRLPDEDPAGWDTLRKYIRRQGEKADGRVLVDDSKKVHAGINGFAKLETSVARWLALESEITLGEFLEKYGLPGVRDEAGAEHWFCPKLTLGKSGLPLRISTMEHGDSVALGPTLVNMVQPRRFNRIVDDHGTKAAVLTDGMIRLIPSILLRLPRDGDDVRFACDKQGGRAYYADMLQSAFPAGIVIEEIERAEESRYRVEGLERNVVVVFRPRSDGESVAVAAASMVCKYLREVGMKRLSEYWAGFVSGLKPTAGYPLDARRFYDEIEAEVSRRGIEKCEIWRSR